MAISLHRYSAVVDSSRSRAPLRASVLCSWATMLGRADIGCGSSWPFSTRRSRPGRSVTRMRPSGRKAIPHGCSSPLVISTMRICSLEVVTTCAAALKGKLVRNKKLRLAGRARKLNILLIVMMCLPVLFLRKAVVTFIKHSPLSY